MKPRPVPAALARAGLCLCVTALAACEPGTGAGQPSSLPSAAKATDVAWIAPTEADIPSDSMGASIRRGLALIRFAPESLPAYAPGSLRCTSCHQNDGTKPSSAPLTGSHARFPRYLARSAAVVTLADRVNYCFTRSLAGNALPHESREMEDILAYLAFISRGVPVGVKGALADGLAAMPDTLVGDVPRGRELFASTCAICHGADGAGLGSIPALWGGRSYSIGASMARQERAASFIYQNMPQTKPGSLTPQQAFDLAAFVNSHPRPDSPGKESDWPAGGAPRDVPYATRGHQPSNPPPALVPRRNPRGALVPPPAPVRRGN